MSEPDIVVTPESETSPAVSIAGSEGVHEFIRYTAASALALLLDTSFLWFLTSIIGISYLLSGAISFVAGLALVYTLSVYWVFTRRTLTNPWFEFLIFSLIGLVGLILNELVLYVFTSLVGLFYLVSKIVSVAVVFAWNFGARKWLLFRTLS